MEATEINSLIEHDESLRQYPLSADQKHQISTFFSNLYRENKKFNLTGYKTIDEYLVYHLLDSLILNRYIQKIPLQSLVDVGTGPGVPGMILAIINPSQHIVLIESNQKKAAFLRETIQILSLENVHVLSGRAEEIAHDKQYREQFDAATAKALGSLSQTSELTCGFVKPGGMILLPRGNEAFDKTESFCGRLNCILEKRETYRLSGRNREFSIVFFKKIAPLEEKFPRKPVQISKRPL